MAMSDPLTVQEVSPVDWATSPLKEISSKKAVEQLLGGPVEGCSDYSKPVVGRPKSGRARGLLHPFVGALHCAYQDHRPLVLSPDMFWLLITQGLAQHINKYAERYRARFGQGKEKRAIKVINGTFFKGSLENPWEDVFGDFSRQIKRHIGAENHANLIASFSTTGKVEKAAGEIVLMDCVKSYFKYEFYTRCGIPQVVLEGQRADWVKLREKTETLGNAFDVAWWTARLLPILDRIAENAAGKDDSILWQTIYKQERASGGPVLSGWIVAFFPYVGEDEPLHLNPGFINKNRPTDWQRQPWKWDIRTASLPSSMSKAPFTWFYYDQQFEMEFLAGFTAFTQNKDTLQLRPKIGWAVREVK
jgi:hypothetical protein